MLSGPICQFEVRKLVRDDQGLLAMVTRGSDSFRGDLGSGLPFCGLGTGTRTLAWGRTPHP